MRKKHLTRKLFTVLFILSILPVSSVMLTNVYTSVTASPAKPDTISVTYRFDETEILNWVDTKQFTKNLRVLSLPGEPLALYRVANILLPPYNEVADVSVVEKIGGQHIVKDIPCGQPLAIIGEEPTIVGKNANIYNSDELYPKEIYRVGSVKSFRGYNILNVRLYPVQYKPASKRALYYKEMTVQVKLKEGSTMDTLRNSVKGREAVETLVDNPSILSTYDSTLVTTETLGTTYEYIIVTTPDLADEFKVLADWKANFVDGAKVVTVNVDANETEIKDVINDYYTNYGTSYVLLGGDVDVITYHTKTCTVDSRVADIAEDYWFANLDGDDEISYYEVYIGRAPVDNEEEAMNFTNKVIAYEQMDKPKANLFHQSRARSGNVPDSRELAWQCEQYVPPDYTNYEIFEENETIAPIEKTDWINFWRNDGIMCEHMGHGGPTGYTINYEVGGEVGWSRTDVASLDNTFWPVHTSVACLSGAFEYEDCLAEAYVKDPDNGAIACLFNDQVGLYTADDATKPSGDFIEMQFKGLYQEGIENIGAMLAYSKHCFIDEATKTGDPEQPGWEWCWREINLIGDPETPLLTKRVQPVNIVKNSGWETGDNSFWNVSTTVDRYSYVDYEVNQDSAYNGSYGFHVSMETDSGKPRYTTQSLMESQSLSHGMLDTNTKLKYRIYPAYELYEVSEIPQARWEIILSFSTGNKLHYYSSLNMEPTENSTDKYVYMPIILSQWNRFFDRKVLETYTSNFGTPLFGTTITKIAAFVTSETYAAKRKKFNRVIANFDSDEDTEGLQCTMWYVKNVDTGLNYTSIQEAINAPETLDGHTVSVMGPFHEHVVVNKSLTLIGQDPSTTIIDGSGDGYVVTVQANNVNISQFTIRNGLYGVYLDRVQNCTVCNNIVSNNSYIGVEMLYSSYNLVSGNTISDKHYLGGVVVAGTYNSIIGNTISNNDEGVKISSYDNNLVIGNTISNNEYGVYLITTDDNAIYHNNFINNTVQAYVNPLSPGVDNAWDDGYPSGGNYWNDYTGDDEFSGPDQNQPGSDGIGDTPYNITGRAGNQDNYPLMHPWESIRNVDTGSIYLTIQKAIDASETLDGHTIEVKAGTYYEEVVVNKSLTIIGEDPSNTIIYSGSWGNSGFLVYSNDTTITGFAVRSYTKCIDLWGCNCKVSGNAFENYEYAIYVEESSSNNIISNNDLSIWGGSYGIYLHFSDSNTISGNLVTDKFIGIYMVCSDQNTITDNTFSYCYIGPISAHSGMYLRESNNNVISGNTITNNEDYGIHIDGANNIVSDNIISDNERTGIWVGGDDNTINDNTISNNWGSDIYISSGSFNTVSGNVISNSGCGIVLDDDNNTIVENTIQNNDEGIYSYSASNTFYHNNFVNNTQQVVVYYSSNNWDDGYPSGGNLWSDYNGTDLHSGPYQNETGSDGIGDTPYIIDENNQDNYPLLQPANLVENIDTGLTYPTIQEAINAPETLDGHTIEVGLGTYDEQVVVSKSLTIKGLHPSTTIIDTGSYGDTGFLISTNDTTITGFTVRKYTKSIDLWGSNCNVSGNAFDGFSYGIYVEEGSSNNIISNNDLSIWGGSYGIYLKYSDNNTIIGNTVIGKFIGIYMLYSNQNTIRNNTFSYCTIKPISSGMYLLESNNNVISGNTISNNNYGIYLKNANGNTVSNNTISDNENVGILVGGDDNTINDNTISNNWHEGIYISSGSFNTVSGNTISNNYHGIYLDDDNNIITENTLSNNDYGVYMWDVSSSTFYHNNFVNNTQQVGMYYSNNNNWDDGYPSGGNYWSDYTGVDEKSGPNQDQPGSDGIGDTPYVIDANNQDNYPLMDPWNP